MIDLRSDTVTQPTEEMRTAMYTAVVGDDVYGEDPTLKKLEKMGAQLLGKEDGLFVTSGTMGNQLAILSHTHRGQEIILEEQSHIFLYEVGGAAFLSGVQTKTVKGEYGILDSEQIEQCIRKDDIHFPSTGLICLENTHNQAGGTVYPLGSLREIYQLGKKYNIPVHMDGARIFNAAAALSIPVSQIAESSDSVMFCLSKGLSAPVGSLLVGTKQFIDRARKYRKMLGGGIRQGGVLAAAGIVALEKMVLRLTEDHKRAKKLFDGLKNIPGISLDVENVDTNILYFDIHDTGINTDLFVEKLRENNILINNTHNTRLRMVIHRHITDSDIDYTLDQINEIIQKR